MSQPSHEKQIASLQYRRFCRSHGGCRCRCRCPSYNNFNVCSSVFGTDSLNSCCNCSCMSGISGFGFGTSPSPTVNAGYIGSVVNFLILPLAGSAWLSQTRQRSTTSLIGVSGGALSKCRRRSQLLWPAMHLSRISRSQAVCPISPNAFTASISKAVAKFAGSSPDVLMVRSNCLL